MNFARKQLEKYGWTDGKGLGKHENGISEALKPKLKRGVTGIGHDLASDFTEHWWTALYDKAADNVQVEEKGGKTKKIKTKEDKFEITNSTWRLKQKKKDPNKEDEEYEDYFVKTAVLTNGVSKTEKVRNSESENEEETQGEKRDAFKMTDEELFAACEGRTAHKGARHGLKALGKLARIERQEKMLLTQPQYKDYSQGKKKEKLSVKDLQVVEDMHLNSDGDSKESKTKKNKKKRCSSKEMVDPVLIESGLENNEIKKFDENNGDTSVRNEEITKNKHKKKSKRKQDRVDILSKEIDESSSKPKKYKIGLENDEINFVKDVSNLIEEGKVKKSKNKKITNDEFIKLFL